MGNIKERISKIKEYFREMQIVTSGNEQIIYVVVGFPDGWTVDDEIEEKYNVSIQEGNSRGEYYFSTDIDTGESAIFDAIDYNIGKMKDAIERARLLYEKTTELKELFQDESIPIASLRALRFEYPKKPLITEKKGKKSSDLSINEESKGEPDKSNNNKSKS